jgi:hypothetical protein
VPPPEPDDELLLEPLEHAVASRPAAATTARHLLTGELNAVRSFTFLTSGLPRPGGRDHCPAPAVPVVTGCASALGDEYRNSRQPGQ